MNVISQIHKYKFLLLRCYYSVSKERIWHIKKAVPENIKRKQSLKGSRHWTLDRGPLIPTRVTFIVLSEWESHRRVQLAVDLWTKPTAPLVNQKTESIFSIYYLLHTTVATAW